MIGKPGLQRFEVNAYGKRIKELSFKLKSNIAKRKISKLKNKNG